MFTCPRQFITTFCDFDIASVPLPSVGIADALGEVLPAVQAVVQGVPLDGGPRHLVGGEAGGPSAPGVHRHHPAQTPRPFLHGGQAQITALVRGQP